MKKYKLNKRNLGWVLAFVGVWVPGVFGIEYLIPMPDCEPWLRMYGGQGRA